MAQLESTLKDLEEVHVEGKKHLADLEGVIDNSNPMEFFTFLLEKNSVLAKYLEEIKQRKKLKLDRWVPPESVELPGETMTDILRLINTLEHAKTAPTQHQQH